LHTLPHQIRDISQPSPSIRLHPIIRRLVASFTQCFASRTIGNQSSERFGWKNREWGFSNKKNIPNDSQGIDVLFFAGIVVASDDFGRGIVHRSRECIPFFARPPVGCGTEIDQLASTLSVENDVLVLDIPVDNPIGVQESDRIGELTKKRSDLE
jgi:hypothetical protein